MAKKITIEGSNLLQSTSDDWGGQNTGSSTIVIHGTPVPAGAEWGINRGEVERFIKKELKGKVGAVRWTQDGNFFYLDGFATESDITTYDSDPETYAALRLFHKQLPISATQVDSYIARLYTNKDTTSRYVVKDGGDFEIGLRFSAIHVIAATSEQENMGGNGTLIIERSINNQQTWTQVGTLSIASSDYNASNYPTVINLGAYLSAGRENAIRIRATYDYTDSSGERATMSSGNTVLAITSATLTVKMMTDWKSPVMASTNAFPMSFAVTGAVEKWLHVTIGGSLGTYTFTERMSAQTEYPETNPRSWTEPEKSSIGILTHGVHAVRAWVTCDDGSGHTDSSGIPDSISSDVIEHQLMVVNTNASDAELKRPRLLMQNVKQMVANYVRTVIADFSVWVPDAANPTTASTSPLDASLRITDAAENDTDYTTVYAQEDYTGAGGLMSGMEYHLDTTVEIEPSSSGTQADEYLAYLRVFRYEGGNLVNFLYESVRQRFITLTVDNRENFAPTSGAWFILNPRSRNNSDADRDSIINAQNGEVIPSSGWDGFGFVSDAWTTAEDGQKVLRVLAGERLTIDLDPWASFIGSDMNAINSQLTLEIDFAVRNITDEDEPVLNITQVADGDTLGLCMYPLEGRVMASDRQAVSDQDFGYEEGKRTHMALTVHPAVVTRAADEMPWMQTLNDTPSSPVPLAKVYLNGSPERDVDYVLKAYSWGVGNGKQMVIGNPYADIDIYGMRIYRTALSAQQVLQDYVASLPTAEEKVAVKRRNDITTNGRVDYEKAKDKGMRCLTWVGQDQYKVNQDKENGYAGYWRIDHDTPALSGTIGKAAYLAYMAGTIDSKKPLMITAQGSTANTYWENNGQTKCDKVTFVVNIPFSKLHADFGWKASKSTGEDCENPMYLNGARIEGTAYAALSDAEKAMVTIDVLDGWFDGNGWSENVSEMGMYHGQFYTCYEGGPKCTKLVNKINYASPMQSHKMGATRMFNDVMKAVLDGGMALHKNNPEVRFAVYEDSFLYFTENPVNNYKTEFHGMCTFGHGKFDKATFGYKQNKNTFAFEGLNNNPPLCNFLVPADEDVIYDPDEESWCYNGTKSFEYGLGKTKEVEIGEEIKEFPTDTNDLLFRRYVNFIYAHNTSLRYYNGTRAQFVAAWNRMAEQSASDPSVAEEMAEMQMYQYWMTNGLVQLRYDYVGGEWVDAGTWQQTSEIDAERGAMTYEAGERNLSTYYMTAAAYEEWRNGSDYGDYAALNKAFRKAYAQHFSNYFGTVAHVKVHQTHYSLVNFLWAGTDNCAKNMYYQYDPESGLFFLDGDDLDSILPNDNNGRQTKKYFLDRIHDVEDYTNGYKPQIDYEGRGSALFNTMECAYEENSQALRQNMREVLSVMPSLVAAGEGFEQSVLGCFEKYFFSIQEYFPEVAYQEQARIRYEWPKSFGYISFGNQARGIDPITQQVGRQLTRERQYMRRRLAYVASYACFGDFSGGVNTGVVGLSDSGSALSLTPGSGNIGGVYQFDVTPHQWLYPVGVADRAVADPHVRVAPGETYRLLVANSGAISGDSSVGLAALNYYRKVGNLGNMVVGNNTLSVVANRLTEFVAEPDNPAQALFRPGTIALSTPNLRRLSLKGVQTMRGAKDFSALRRVETVDLRDTNIAVATMPVSQTLHSLYLPSTLTSLALTGQLSLATLELQGVSTLTQLTVTGCPLLGGAPTLGLVVRMVTADTTRESLTSLMRLDNLAWTGVEAKTVRWLLAVGDRGTCVLEGSIALPSGQILMFDEVVKLIRRYGNIRSNQNSLYIEFPTIPIMLANVGISGRKYVVPSELEPYEGAESYAGWWRELGLQVTAGNNVAVDVVDGVVKPAVTWEIATAGVSAYVTIPDAYSPDMLIKQVVKLQLATVRATLRTINDENLVVEKSVGLWNRIPEVGDYAWTDGEFDAENDNSKRLAGVVIMREPLEYDEDDNITKCKLWVMSSENATIPQSSDGSSASVPSVNDQTFSNSWGIYPSATLGLPDKNDQGEYMDELVQAIIEAMGKADPFDTPLPNKGTDFVINPATYQDVANNTPVRGAVELSGVAHVYGTVGDGAGYLARTETQAAMDFATEGENEALMTYANIILTATYNFFGISQENYAQSIARGDVDANGFPITLQGLADMRQLIVQKAETAGATDVARYRELMFNAVRACHCWSPASTSGTGITEESLHEQYRRGKWMLPSNGLLARIFNFLYNSSCTVDPQTGEKSRANSAAPIEANWDESVSQEALLPLFSNCLHRGRGIPISSGSTHWSSTEVSRNYARNVYFSTGNTGNGTKYISNTVRPVTAFTFSALAE